MMLQKWCFLGVCLLGISRPVDAAQEFHSAWSTQGSGIWVGPAYWANPMQDWRIRQGRLECTTQGKDRSVHLLTYQLRPASALTMHVRVGRLVSVKNSWAGFRFAIHGRLTDYRHNCIYGEGINAGITTGGELFLGDVRQAVAWDNEALLELNIVPGPTGMSAVVLKLLPEGPELRLPIQSERLTGNLALVSHVEGKVQRDAPVFTFQDWQVKGEKLAGGVFQNWGPILWTQYTLSHQVLKLSAQFPPMGVRDSRDVTLEIRQGGDWETIGSARIDEDARLALFRIPAWESNRDIPYRVVYRWLGQDYTWPGIIRRDPTDEAELTVAGFTGNKDYGFPNNEIVANLRTLDPDVLFFSGDQIYESVAGFGIIREPVELATLDYLRKWYLYGWAFGDVLRDRPSVALPDDHDVYQGNIWGMGGRPSMEGGGYTMAPRWVNMVQRTQTAHFPDPADPRPVEQGIGVYYTEMCYGRVSFAILEDRKFKSGPLPYRQGKRDHAEAVLLGERQLDFLRDWAAHWQGADMKCTLSQTVFAQCHTYGGNEVKPIKRDFDANGWPPQARDAALAEIRKAFAFMYAGDNHLPTVAHHGIDDWEDAGVSFTTPSIAAGFPRAWWPEKAGLTREEGAPDYLEGGFAAESAYLGRYRSAWDHPLTILAAANPKVWRGHGNTPAGDIQLLDDKSSGFGFVRFNKETRKVTVECYRILADLTQPEAAQFNDWPVVIDQKVNYGRKAQAYLPEVKVEGLTNPVFQVIENKTGEVVYTLRIKGPRFEPHVFALGTYTLRIGDPDQGQWQCLTDVTARARRHTRPLTVTFEKP